MSRFVFGPVASRRLGVSLGVDLVPRKSCSLDCVYCEAGATDKLSGERKKFMDIEEVKSELAAVLNLAPAIDFITFSGAGEPTLNIQIGEVIDFIKDNYPAYKLCLLTNATTFGDKELLKSLKRVDLVMPSLDASNEEEFQLINRPAEGIHFDEFFLNLENFCLQARPEQVIVELFIVPGKNDSDESIARFTELIRRLKISTVQLNTLDRPGCVDWIRPSSKENTMRFIKSLEKIVKVEAVGPFRYRNNPSKAAPSSRLEEEIIQLVNRRPATVEDIALATSADKELVKALMARLLENGLVAAEKLPRGEFFSGAGRL